MLLNCLNFISAQDEISAPVLIENFAPVGDFLYDLYDDKHAELIGATHELSGNVTVSGNIEHNGNQYDVTVVSGLSNVFSYNDAEGKYESVGTYNRDYTNVTSITFSDNIERIVDRNILYFNHCNVINIPKTVTYISPDTYQLHSNQSGYTDNVRGDKIAPYVYPGAALFFNDITFNVAQDNNTYTSVDGVLFDKDMKTLIRCPKGKEGIYVVPNGVERIEDCAFFGCFMLTKIILPESVRILGSPGQYYYDCCCFYHCLMLQDINIPEGVERIGFNAFRNCCNLTTLHLPSTLKYFDTSAISGNGMKISNINWSNCSLEILMINGTLYGSDFTVSLPKSIKSIKKPEDYSYTLSMYGNDCTIPESLIIPATLEECEANLISNGSITDWSSHLSPLKDLYALSETPLDISEGFFGYDRKVIQNQNYMTSKAASYEEVFPQTWADQCTLYVPNNSIDAYKTHSVWGKFPTIVGLSPEEIDVITSVNKVKSPTISNHDRVYNLAGQKFATPSKGIYIRNGKKIIR